MSPALVEALRRPAVLLPALLLILAPPLAARQGDTERRPEVSAYLVVLAGRLNIREAPTLDARVVGVASRGEKLCAVRYDGDWSEVRTPVDERGRSGRTIGFVSRGFVSEIRATRQELEEIGCRQHRSQEDASRAGGRPSGAPLARRGLGALR